MPVSWPSARGKSVYKALLKLGFHHEKTKGSHHFLVWPDAPEVGPIQVPVHGQLEYPKQFVKRKWREANAIMGVSQEDFLKALKKSR